MGQITSKKAIMGGTPCIRGTRIPVWCIKSFDHQGYSVEQIMDEYPSLTAAQILAALKYRERRSMRKAPQALNGSDSDYGK